MLCKHPNSPWQHFELYPFRSQYFPTSLSISSLATQQSVSLLNIQCTSRLFSTFLCNNYHASTRHAVQICTSRELRIKRLQFVANFFTAPPFYDRVLVGTVACCMNRIIQFIWKGTNLDTWCHYFFSCLQTYFCFNIVNTLSITKLKVLQLFERTFYVMVWIYLLRGSRYLQNYVKLQPTLKIQEYILSSECFKNSQHAIIAVSLALTRQKHPSQRQVAHVHVWNHYYLTVTVSGKRGDLPHLSAAPHEFEILGRTRGR